MTIVDVVLEALVRAGVGVALAIAAVLALRGFVRRSLGARAVRLVWLAVPLSLLSALLPVSIGAVAKSQDTAAVIAPSVIAMVDVGARVATSWWHVMLGIWLAGALVLALLLVYRQRRFDSQLIRTGEGAELRLPVGASPAVVGAWRPRLALPLDFESRFTSAEQALVLAHESAHLRHHDGAWSLLASILWCAQWFNPMAWFAIRAFRDDLESACDAEVMRTYPRAARTYAAALLKQAESDGAPLVSAWASRHPLVDRIADLDAHRRQRHYGRPRAALALLLCAAVASLAHAASPRDLQLPTGERHDVSRFISVSLEVIVADAAIAKPMLVVRAGETASIRVDGPAGFALEVTPRGVEADRIAVALRHAPASAQSLVALGEQIVFAGGGPVVFDSPAAYGSGALRIRVTANWISEVELDALRSAEALGGRLPAQPAVENSPALFPAARLVPDRSLTVMLRVRVAVDGSADDAQVDHIRVDSGVFDADEREQFGSEALAAVRGWRFTPAKNAAGIAEERWVLVPIRYSTRAEDMPQG